VIADIGSTKELFLLGDLTAEQEERLIIK